MRFRKLFGNLFDKMLTKICQILSTSTKSWPICSHMLTNSDQFVYRTWQNWPMFGHKNYFEYISRHAGEKKSCTPYRQPSEREPGSRFGVHPPSRPLTPRPEHRKIGRVRSRLYQQQKASYNISFGSRRDLSVRAFQNLNFFHSS